jgi:predicted enzyme related to lactoylglutathione lyase
LQYQSKFFNLSAKDIQTAKDFFQTQAKWDFFLAADNKTKKNFHLK